MYYRAASENEDLYTTFHLSPNVKVGKYFKWLPVSEIRGSHGDGQDCDHGVATCDCGRPAAKLYVAVPRIAYQLIYPMVEAIFRKYIPEDDGCMEWVGGSHGGYFALYSTRCAGCVDMQAMAAELEAAIAWAGAETACPVCGKPFGNSVSHIASHAVRASRDEYDFYTYYTHPVSGTRVFYWKFDSEVQDHQKDLVIACLADYRAERTDRSIPPTEVSILFGRPGPQI
jgi:hypothetical protein